jgi:hypothetical protein
VVVLSLIGCQKETDDQINGGNVTLIIKSLGTTKTERFKFSSGTPLEVVKYNHRVKTVLNDNFIECIDDVCADGGYWWLFYVNNKTINYGVKRYNLIDGDVILFEFNKQD